MDNTETKTQDSEPAEGENAPSSPSNEVVQAKDGKEVAATPREDNHGSEVSSVDDGEARVAESEEEEDEEEDSDAEDTTNWDPLDETTSSEKIAEFALPSHLRPVAG